eukprot:4304612-Amphidinium_carterae.1
MRHERRTPLPFWAVPKPDIPKAGDAECRPQPGTMYTSHQTRRLRQYEQHAKALQRQHYNVTCGPTSVRSAAAELMPVSKMHA